MARPGPISLTFAHALSLKTLVNEVERIRSAVTKSVRVKLIPIADCLTGAMVWLRAVISKLCKTITDAINFFIKSCLVNLNKNNGYDQHPEKIYSLVIHHLRWFFSKRFHFYFRQSTTSVTH